MTCVEANFESCQKRQHTLMVLMSRKVPEVPVITLERILLSLPEAKEPLRQFLATHDPANINNFSEGAI